MATTLTDGSKIPIIKLVFEDKRMEPVLIAVVIVLIVFVLALLIWLISTNFAGRKEIAGQAAGISLLAQQLESLKTAQDKTSENLQKSLQAGQTTLTQSLQSSQHVLSRLNTQIGELQGQPTIAAFIKTCWRGPLWP